VQGFEGRAGNGDQVIPADQHRGGLGGALRTSQHDAGRFITGSGDGSVSPTDEDIGIGVLILEDQQFGVGRCLANDGRGGGDGGSHGRKGMKDGRGLVFPRFLHGDDRAACDHLPACPGVISEVLFPVLGIGKEVVPLTLHPIPVGLWPSGNEVLGAKLGGSVLDLGRSFGDALVPQFGQHGIGMPACVHVCRHALNEVRIMNLQEGIFIDWDLVRSHAARAVNNTHQTGVKLLR